MQINSLEMSQISGIKHNLIKRFIFKHLNDIAKIGDIKITRIESETIFILDKFQAFHIASMMWNTPKAIDLKINLLQKLKDESEEPKIKGVKELKEEKLKKPRSKKEKAEKE